ncbi:MAG: carbohydrate ABC transporter permease [Candidatus Caldatribacterium sp.]|nr:carbohydrate ABC transporter permease [Candidatus Caldatribacterium sp.]
MAKDFLKLAKGRWLDLVWEVLSYFVLFVGALIIITPFVWMLSTSFGTAETAFSLPPRWIPNFFNVRPYRQLLEATPFLRYMWNSFKVSSLITLGQLITCSTAAYAFARIRFRGRDFIFFLLLSSMMIPIQVTVVPLFILMRGMGLYDTHASLILPVTISAFGVFLLRQFFLTIPVELEEAARIDGASYFTIYLRIVLPLSGSALSTLAVLCFLYFWNELFRPLIFLSSIEKYTIPLGLVMLRGQHDVGSPIRSMAAVTLAIIPAVIIFVLAQRYLVKGITMTGLKE